MGEKRKTLGQIAFEAYEDEPGAPGCARLWEEDTTPAERTWWQAAARAVAAEVRRRDRAKAKGGRR